MSHETSFAAVQVLDQLARLWPADLSKRCGGRAVLHTPDLLDGLHKSRRLKTIPATTMQRTCHMDGSIV